MKKSYQPPKIDYKKRRKSLVVPDQSLSIRDIVSRYVRGVPVDITQRQGVYLDQQDDDLEKLSRMDFGEKAMYADAMGERAQNLSTELQERERNRREANEQKAKDKEKGAPSPQA